MRSTESGRKLGGVPEQVMFAAKPQLASALLARVQSLGIRAAFVAGGEVYGGRELRRDIRQREMGYVMAARANHAVTAGSGRIVTAAGAVSMIPHYAWHRLRTGSGTKGTRHYDWAMLEVTSDDTPDGHAGGRSVLLARRHRYTGTLSFYRCRASEPIPLSRLIAGMIPITVPELLRLCPTSSSRRPGETGPPAALVNVAAPPPAPRSPGPPTLERLRRDNTMTTTTYSRLKSAAIRPASTGFRSTEMT
jgi:hypothetical protein